ncbi:hypothetical protein [Candidatus Macondimonas diazotrophica]|uniref:Flagellar protein FliT n=1 Tax=Candidatus Macondimonas diazotrophica TaxID=2305248 RepID=A0A4Z0FBK4_9GAMM|nr:hypothetical protein [Candidatus Macondimonas diazotrophica]NCU00888.1 hypothetical protein [Candidatus Macondimonas diazotrophica]TFZ83283.1 hypothetical protein E4680_04325 [Candidatus Macondimonas diazotrophica]
MSPPMGEVVSLLQPERQRTLDELDTLSQSMLASALAGDWDIVAAAQPEFETGLRRLCAGQSTAAEAFVLMQALRRLQERISHLEDLAHSQHAELSLHLRRMHRHQGAVRIYQTAAGSGHGHGGHG